MSAPAFLQPFARVVARTPRRAARPAGVAIFRIATVILSAVLATVGVAQDGFNALPADARDAGLAYRKLLAVDTGSRTQGSAAQKNLQEPEPQRSRCAEATRQFCTDFANAEFEFRPLKALLPATPRLTPHNVYVRRNKVTVAYTFK
jgi:hypothetical protein